MKVTPVEQTLVDVLVQDLASFGHEPAIEKLRYAKDGTGSEAHDLKPPPGVFAAYLRDLVEAGRAAGSDPNKAASATRSLAFASAFATDVAVDNKGNTKPTALHFTAGQQEFLSMVGELIKGTTEEDLREALFGPWRYDRPLPVLSWDNTTARDWALRAENPSKEAKLGVPGADWLAFRGLPFVPVAPVRDRIVTTGCTGGWKTGELRWPIWSAPLTRPVIASLLGSPELATALPDVLKARGVEVVLDAAIRRSDQGGYGTFAPARVAQPRGAK